MCNGVKNLVGGLPTCDGSQTPPRYLSAKVGTRLANEGREQGGRRPALQDPLPAWGCNGELGLMAKCTESTNRENKGNRGVPLSSRGAEGAA